MRRLVGVLRRRGRHSRTRSGFGDIDRLLEEIYRASHGGSDQLRAFGPCARDGARRLPGCPEALTNVVRHAGVDHAGAGTRGLDGALVPVVGYGPPTRPVKPIESGGHGISGMEERVSLYGGTLMPARPMTAVIESRQYSRSIGRGSDASRNR